MYVVVVAVVVAVVAVVVGGDCRGPCDPCVLFRCHNSFDSWSVRVFHSRRLSSLK